MESDGNAAVEDLPRPSANSPEPEMLELHGNEVGERAQSVSPEDGPKIVPNHRCWVTTASQITGLHVEEKFGIKTLSWNKRTGGFTDYKITTSRNGTALSPITTSQTSLEFPCLEGGHYLFQVSSDRSRISEPYYVMVPDAPEVDIHVLTFETIRVTFPAARFADKYRIAIFNQETRVSFETTECDYKIGNPEYIFEKGVKYAIVAHAICKGMSSMPSGRKEFVTGLELPTNFRCDLDHGDPQRSLKCSWKNSARMLEAKIQLRTFERELVAEKITARSDWNYWGLKPNKKYEIFLSPGDGNIFFEDDVVRHKFTTAPLPPQRVGYWRWKEHRHDRMQIEVTSDYKGPFRVTVTERGKMFKEPKIFKGKCFAIKDLKPKCIYEAAVQCKFGNYLTPPTIAKPLRGHSSEKCREVAPASTESARRRRRTLSNKSSPPCRSNGQEFDSRSTASRDDDQHPPSGEEVFDEDEASNSSGAVEGISPEDSRLEEIREQNSRECDTPNLSTGDNLSDTHSGAE